MAEAQFETQRKKILRKYIDAGQPFVASTKPYKSTRSMTFQVVYQNANVATGRPAGFMVAVPQDLEFFTYGVTDSVSDGLGIGTQRAVDEDDTNLAKGNSTNGAEDYVIEGVGFGVKGIRVASIAYRAQLVAAVPPVTDPNVLDMVLGAGRIMLGADSFAVFAPPQTKSALALEDAMLQAIIHHSSLEFEWDRTRTEKLGTVDLLPEAGASSYLRSNGQPRADNRYRIPEGYVWRRDGEPDSEFVARVRLRKAVVIPFDVLQNPFGAADAAPPLYNTVVLDLSMRLYGLGVRLPSRN